MLWQSTEIYDINENFPHSPVPNMTVVPWNLSAYIYSYGSVNGGR